VEEIAHVALLIFAPRLVLLKWYNEGGWARCGMWLVRGRR